MKNAVDSSVALAVVVQVPSLLAAAGCTACCTPPAADDTGAAAPDKSAARESTLHTGPGLGSAGKCQRKGLHPDGTRPPTAECRGGAGTGTVGQGFPRETSCADPWKVTWAFPRSLR